MDSLEWKFDEFVEINLNMSCVYLVGITVQPALLRIEYLASIFSTNFVIRTNLIRASTSFPSIQRIYLNYAMSITSWSFVFAALFE